MRTPEIYFHVGLGKVASTYLQYKVFPKLQGIHYIQRTQYKQCFAIMTHTTSAKYLISRECDQQLGREVEKFAASSPHTGILLILRRPDSWLASQYRRFVKNGFHKPFPAFFDLDYDTGLFKKADLDFFGKIRFLERCFPKKPLVLIYDELLHDPFAFIDKIAQYTGTTYDKSQISLTPKHRSYTDKQLKVMQRVSRHIPLRAMHSAPTPGWRRCQKLPLWLLRYSILYGAELLPTSWVPAGQLIPANQLDRIRQAYAENWQQCLAYAEQDSSGIVSQ